MLISVTHDGNCFERVVLFGRVNREAQTLRLDPQEMLKKDWWERISNIAFQAARVLAEGKGAH